MSDPLRQLAAEHPGLLTVECECVPKIGDHDYGLGGPVGCLRCDGTGSRLKTLEELLEAIVAEGIAPTLDYEGAGWSISVGYDMEYWTDFWPKPSEAAARLLVEVSRDG